MIVDFWVFWCGLCKMLGFVFEVVVIKVKGVVIMVKVNVDEN